MSADLERALLAARRAEASRDPAALRLWEGVARLDPTNALAWSKIGVLQAQAGALEKSVAAFEAAVRAAPFHAVLHFNLARSFFAANRPHDAIEAYRAAVQLNPPYADAYIGWIEALGLAAPPAVVLSVCELALGHGASHPFLTEQRGRQLIRLRRHAEAADALRLALEGQQANLSLRLLYSTALLESGRPEESLAEAERALELNPSADAAYLAKVIALLGLERVDEALEGLAEFVAKTPDSAEGKRVYGIALVKAARFNEALAPLSEAVEREPAQVDLWEALGATYGALHQAANGAECFKRADALLVDLGVPAEQRLKGLNQQLNYLSEAMLFDRVIETCDALSELSDEAGFVVGRRAFALAMVADWGRLPRAREELATRVTTSVGDTAPFNLFPFFDDPDMHREFSQAHSRFLWDSVVSARPGRAPDLHARPLRVGYLSGDFRDHPVGRLMAPLLEHHDRSLIEPVALSTWLAATGSAESEVTARIRRSVHEYVELGELNDAAAANRIRACGLDLVVDLAGHTLGCRPGVLARGCAPLQVQYLGTPGTTGASFIDAVVADAHVIPPGFESFYSERVLRLPHSYLPPGDRPVVERTGSRSDHGLPADGCVLGAFHSTYKISPEVYACWMEVLRACPAAMLWINILDPVARAAMRDAAEAAGIATQRLVFADREPDHLRHLQRMTHVDLMLDTFPYGSHSAALDALWAGVPILALQGRSFASRVCAGLLQELGLASLVTESMAAYTDRAVELVSGGALPALRQSLLAQRNHPLFDPARHARDFENLITRFVREAGDR